MITTQVKKLIDMVIIENEKAEILERINDKNRRYKNFYHFAVGKKVLDFGCGAGDFLKIGLKRTLLKFLELSYK